MGRLTLCGAGAGTGKTHSICETITARVIEENLDPARVLATTFTIQAAAELKGRIQSRLLAEESLAPARRIELAERLELAAIGTVDAIAYGFLGRFALHLGLSPRLRIADEDASPRYLEQALQRTATDGWLELTAQAARLDQSDIEQTALDLLEVKRSNEISDENFRQQMAECAARLCEVLAPDGVLPELDGPSPIPRLAREVFAAIDESPDDTVTTRKTRWTLKQLARLEDPSWADHGTAARVKGSKRYRTDEPLEPLRAVASQVRRHPGLHRDVQEFMARLAQQTIALGQEYQHFKARRGLLDFTDLEVEFLRLLRHPELAAEIAAGIDLVVVDEFQDTDPLQLAIFLRLEELVPESIWVGDEKQAIFGFRGADSRLMKAVWDHAGGETETRLDVNYRSQGGLVHFVNEVFSPVFGDEMRVTAHHPAGPLALERWRLDSSNQDGDARATARGIAELHGEGVPLGDIAALVRTNDEGRRLGAALDDLGLPAVIELPGLLEFRECALALAGLRLVADRRDGLAAATILQLLHTDREGTPGWLDARLREVREDHRQREAGQPRASFFPWQGDPRLAGLDEVRRRATTLTPAEVTQEVIGALELPSRVANWGNPELRLGHLDAFLSHARMYEQSARDRERPATLGGLVATLEELAREGLDLRTPTRGLAALTISTYHGAKGLEWPTVVLCGLDDKRGPNLWRPAAHGGHPEARDPLEGRRVHYWPWPFGSRRGGLELKPDALASPEGLRATDDEAKEATRLLYVGMTRARDRLILAHRVGKNRLGKGAWLDRAPAVHQWLPPDTDAGTYEIRELETTARFRDLRPRAGVPEPHGEGIPWDLPGDGRPRRSTPARLTPSAQGPSLRDGNFAVEELEPPAPRVPADEIESQVFGNAVHAYLAALPSLKSASPDHRVKVARDCLVRWGVGDALDAAPLVSIGERLESWVAQHHPEPDGWQWFTETPVSAPRAGAPPGGKWSGHIDLLLVRDRHAVVIDHKTAALTEAGRQPYAQRHTGQLEAYREALDAQDFEPVDLWLHLPFSDAILRWEPERDEPRPPTRPLVQADLPFD